MSENPTHHALEPVRDDAGEVASWLILMAALAAAALAAGVVLSGVITGLAGNVAAGAGVTAQVAAPASGSAGVAPGGSGALLNDGGAPGPALAEPAPSGAPGSTERTAAVLAADVYDRNGSGAPEGWTRIDPDALPDDLAAMGVTREMLIDERIGYDAAIYQSDDGGYIVAFRGTDGGVPGEEARDHINGNLPQQFGQRAPQYDRAVELVATMAAGVPDGELAVTGHSLGGGLASVAAVANGVPATVYDPAGIHPATLGHYDADPARADELITAYRVDGEILAHDHVPVDTPLGWTRNENQPTLGTLVTLPAIDTDGTVLPPLVDPGPGPGIFASRAERDAWNDAMEAFTTEARRRHGMDFVRRGLGAAGVDPSEQP